MGHETIDGLSVRAFAIAAMRLAGVPADEDILVRVLPLVEAALADGPLLARAAGAMLEPLSHPAAAGPRP